MHKVISRPLAFRLLTGLLFWTPFLPALCRAAVNLPHVFSDHAVLQKSDRTPVWGTAAPGETITVQLGAASAKATADNQGAWRVALDLRTVGEGPFEMNVAGSSSGGVKLTDILVGEVWLCGGQSNMRFGLRRAIGGEEEAAGANDSKLRFLSVGLKVSDAPLHDIKERWVTCDPKSAAGFSAVGYFTGKSLRGGLNTPVGLIDASWSGTLIETWMNPDTLAADTENGPAIYARFAKQQADYPAKVAEFEAKKVELLAAWEKDAAQAKAAGKPEPSKPGPGRGGPESLDMPSGTYNGMILPVAPYGVRGVVWYQGEQNSGRGYQYRRLLPETIADWRKLWGQAELPFMIVQLPNFAQGKVETEPGPSFWAELREAQALAAKDVPNTGLVVTIDVGNDNDVHPLDKKTVGDRMGRLIQKQVYRLPVKGEVNSPTFKDMKVGGDGTVAVSFEHAAGLRTRDGKPPTDFAIAGEDHKFIWAQAAIQGETVRVRADAVPKPVAVRYDWANAPHGNLCNGDGLPAAPFRTDDSNTVSRNNK